MTAREAIKFHKLFQTLFSPSLSRTSISSIQRQREACKRERIFIEITPRMKGKLLWLPKYRGSPLTRCKLDASKRKLMPDLSGCNINVAHLTRSHLPVASAIQNITENWKISKTGLSIVKRTVTVLSTKVHVLYKRSLQIIFKFRYTVITNIKF